MYLFLFLSLLILYGVQLLHNVEGGGFSNITTKPNSDQHSEPVKVEDIYSRYILILGTMTVIAAILVLFIEVLPLLFALVILISLLLPLILLAMINRLLLLHYLFCSVNIMTRRM
jgi:hypothetical protein